MITVGRTPLGNAFFRKEPGGLVFRNDDMGPVDEIEEAVEGLDEVDNEGVEGVGSVALKDGAGTLAGGGTEGILVLGGSRKD
jgi:hypothetical protein